MNDGGKWKSFPHLVRCTLYEYMLCSALSYVIVHCRYANCQPGQIPKGAHYSPLFFGPENLPWPITLLSILSRS